MTNFFRRSGTNPPPRAEAPPPPPPPPKPAWLLEKHGESMKADVQETVKALGRLHFEMFQLSADALSISPDAVSRWAGQIQMLCMDLERSQERRKVEMVEGSGQQPPLGQIVPIEVGTEP